MSKVQELLNKLNFNEESSNISMSIPLFMRLLEYAKEDASDDKSLHILVENASNLGSRVLDMSDYDNIVAGLSD